MNNLYLIIQDKNSDYDTFDSAVVCAKNKEEAKTIHPNTSYKWHDNSWYFQYADKTESRESSSTYDWCKPKYVNVIKIGVANKNIKSGEVICSSFNAG